MAFDENHPAMPGADAGDDLLIRLARGDLPAAQAEAARQNLGVADLERLAVLESAASLFAADAASSPPSAAVSAAKRLFSDQRPGLVRRLADGLRAVAASFDFDSRLEPAPAGFRGVSGVDRVGFSIDSCEIDIELRAGPDGHVEATGQIIADTPGPWDVRFEPVAGGADTRGPVAARTDAAGSFRVRLDEDAYRMLADRDGLRIEAGPFISA